jgi:putative thioredoxin
MNKPAPEPWVIETSDDTFQVDVFDRSNQQLVVLDFWSENCQSCMLLAPILEKVVNEFDGAVALVKANTELLPQLAGEFQVQAVPAVCAILDGGLIDSFQGLVPEETIREWLEKLIRHKQLLSLKQLEKVDADAAEEQYREILKEDAESPHANIGLARLLVARDCPELAAEIIARLEDRGFLEPEAKQVKATLALDADGGDLAAARAATEADPGDPGAQLALAEALASAGEHEEAMEISLSLIANDRERTGKDAHQLMLTIFSALPDDSDLVSAYRRRLATTLY